MKKKCFQKILYITAIVIVIVLILLGYRQNWTGFAPYELESQLQISQKKLWDWLDLLIIPLSLAILGYWLNKNEQKREEEQAIRLAEFENILSVKRHQELILNNYLEAMSSLLLNKNLASSNPNDPVRIIARSRTIAILNSLSNKQKGIVLQFLAESGLINKSNLIVDLKKANFCGAQLVGANLRNVDLSEVYICNSYLFNADFSGAYLHNTDFHGSDFTSAILDKADLSAADFTDAKNLTKDQLNSTKSLFSAFMPDGSIHK